MYGNARMHADILRQPPEIPENGNTFADLNFLQLKERFAEFTESINDLKAKKERLKVDLWQTKVERSILVGNPSNPFGRSGLITLLSGRETREWRKETRKTLDAKIKTLKADIWVNKIEIRVLDDYLAELTARIAAKVDEQGAAPISDDPPDYQNPPDYPADECPPTYAEATAD